MQRNMFSFASGADIHSKGISAVTVGGFKSIHGLQTVTVRPLTVLSGANSSGKSSIMQPLLMLKQTIDAPYDSGSLMLYGQNVKFTSSEQFLCRHSGASCNNSLSIQLSSGEKWVRWIYKIKQGEGIWLEKIVVPTKDGAEFEFYEGMESSLIEKYVKLADGVARSFLQFGKKNKMNWRIGRERCFFNYKLSDNSDALGLFRPVPAEISACLESMIHVPGLRGNPERTYKVSGVSGTYSGTFDSYVASILHQWQKEAPEKITSLGRVLASLGLTWKIASEKIDDTQVGIKVGRMTRAQRGGARDLVSIADVGFGLSQVLPVLVALLAAKPGQLVYIEQPEIHLHPNAQWHLARFVAEIAQTGVLIVVETHSALFLKGIQTLVAKGELESGLVSLNWFERDAKTGMTTVTAAEFDENGAFGSWPVDFDDISLRADEEYLDAVENRMVRHG